MKQIINISESGTPRVKEMMLTVIRLSIPAIMAQISSIIMQYIDAAMVGSLGESATASIGLISTTMWLIGGLCVSLATGFSVQIAQLAGARDNEGARSVFRQGLIAALMFGALISAAALSISRSLPVWLGGVEGVTQNSTRYFFIYACALPIMQIRMLCSSSLQCGGDLKTPGLLNILMCVLDVVFNFIFIFPTRALSVFGAPVRLFGFDLGVAGAALGTACAELCAAALMFYSAAFRSEILSLRLKGSWKIRLKCIKAALRISIPAAFEHTVMCGAQVVTTLIVAPLGTAAVAANSLAITAESLCYMPGYGIGTAATTLVGRSIGADRKDIAKRFAVTAVVLGVAIMSAAAVLMYAAAPFMFSMLTPSEQVRALGTEILRIEAFAEPMYAASIVCSGALRGAGDTLVPSLLNLLTMWGVRITLAFALVPRLGLRGAWIAMCVELCVRGILFLIRLMREKWLENNIMQG